MFSVKTNKVKNVLDVDDDFATLVDVTPSSMIFKFHYKMDSIKSLQRNTLRVKISLRQSDVVLKNIAKAKPVTGLENAREDVQLLQMKSMNVKDAAVTRESETIASAIGDITTKISNTDAAAMSKKGATAVNFSSTMQTKVSYVPASQAKQSGQFSTSMDRTSAVPSDKRFISPQSVSLDMIMKQGIDPSSVVGMSHKSMTSHDAVGGFKAISRAAQEVSTDSSVRLRDYLVAPTRQVYKQSDVVPDGEYVQVLEQKVRESVMMHTEINISKSRYTSSGNIVKGKVAAGRSTQSQSQLSSSYVVKFELLDDKDRIVDSVTKSLDTARHMQEYYTPKTAPSVRVARGAVESKSNLEIVQVDTKATRVRVFRKYIDSSDVNIDPYTLVGEYDLMSGERTLIAVDIPRSSHAIYRVIPVSQTGALGVDFSNVVVKPLRYVQPHYVAVTTKIVSSGVQVDVGSFPPGVVAIRILRRNASAHEDWTYLRSVHTLQETEITKVDNQSLLHRTLLTIPVALASRPLASALPDTLYHGSTLRVNSVDTVSQIDTEVDEDQVFEYTVELIYRDGIVKRSGFSTIQYVPLNKGFVKLSLSGVVVSSTVADESMDKSAQTRKSVTFNIKSVITETSHDLLKRSLMSQGLYDHYVSEMNDERDQLSKIVAYQVKRVDMTSGQVVDYGVVSTDQFVENDYIDKSSSTGLVSGRKYRYDVIPLLRDPETMLDKFTKTETDATTKRQYTFKPSKSFHPLSLRTGTITSTSGRDAHYGNESMVYGKLGQAASIEINLSSITPTVTNLRAARFNVLKNIVSWRLSDDDKRVDHFIIMKDVQGIRTIIGKVHTEFVGGDFSFYHDITRRDVGPISYVVVPVFMDYSHGTEFKTSTVFVDPNDVEDINERSRTTHTDVDTRVLK